jgi:3-(3-hydroxy-phenyl)propionate hydroxylase
MPDVIVVGSGPTGMMLAGELALAGVDVEILERRPTADLVGSRAGGIHSRTIEILDQRGIADRFLTAGRTAQTARFGSTVLDIADLPTRHPYGLALWQDRMEPILAEWVAELGVPTRRGAEVVGVDQDEERVGVRLADGTSARARYLVGADGGRSLVRRQAGIAFPGSAATRSTLIAEVEVGEEPPTGMRQDAAGVHGLQPLADGRTHRVVTTEARLGGVDEPTLADLSAALTAVFGTDFGVHSPTWISRFTDATRQAAEYRRDRILLAGDAAHIHSPAGGQGIGLGIQDAVNLGWKLAQVVHGTSPDSLLDSYFVERHPADARALEHSMAQTVLQRFDERTRALARTVDELMRMDEPRVRVAALIHGLDVAYGSGAEHPQVGRRIPDLDLDVAGGTTRLFAHLRDARPLLLNLGEPGRFDGTPRPERVRLVDAAFTGSWELPVIGTVPRPSAVLIRPDGHVAWVDTGEGRPLSDALEAWF